MSLECLFAGKVYEMVAQPNGIVFSYCKEVIDSRVVIGYKMISFDTKTITDVAKNIYWLSKFGCNYRAVVSLCNNYVTARSLVLPTGRVFMSEDNGRAILFDSEGMPLWTGELTYRGIVPSDIAIYKNALWASYSSSNVLLRFNLSTMREELRIGGNSSPFNKPHSMFLDGDEAIISNLGSNKLIKINLDTYNVTDFLEFNEPVHSYLKVKNFQFLLMESGIYAL